MQYARATLVGVLNSNASSDAEARQRVVRLYRPLLGFAFMIDICCAVTLMIFKCDDQEDDQDLGSVDEVTVWSCMRQEMKDGLSLPSLYKEYSGFGDLVWLSLIRSILTSVILYAGIRFGCNTENNEDRLDSDSDGDRVRGEDVGLNSSGQNSSGLTRRSQEDTCIILPRPLLNGESGSGNGAGTAATSSSLLEPLLNRDESQLTNEQDNRSHASSQNESQQSNSTPSWFHRLKPSPGACKNTTLVFLFLTSTFFQIYAGVKVSTYEYTDESRPTPLLPILMCLTILWINAQSYFFRVLLEEMTREEGLFLPEEIHRHPVFYEESRGVAMHWCDLCHQRIKPNSGGCYRCSLCDFDICMACSKRSDAATVGENVLRGDSGVRTEIALDNKGYFTRTLRVVKPELGLILVSLILLACTSVTR